METLSAQQARRIALAAQGFAEKRPVAPGKRHLLKTVERLGVIQIDSVNVVSRTHYLPFFSRLGAYPRHLLDELAWGKRPQLVEYWAHEASLIPPSTHSLLRWRMADAAEGVGVWKGVARFLREHPALVERALSEIDRRGPLSAADLEIGGKGAGGWWGWSEAKRAVECLFWTGQVTTATRRGTFERVYGITERVLPKPIAARETPSREDAQRDLIRIAARALGVATERDLRDYFRMGPADTRARVSELVEIGELKPVSIRDWPPAFLHSEAKTPRKIRADALLSPFDNLVWFRERTERLFALRLRLEIYTPAEKRVHGYYVLPCLQDEAITARVDLKADRKGRALLVQAAHAEPGATPETPVRLAFELIRMAQWLDLERVQVVGKGDLAPALAARLP